MCDTAGGGLGGFGPASESPLLRKEETFTSSYTKAERSKEDVSSQQSAGTGRFKSWLRAENWWLTA
jgi:hypothetical protein